MRIDRVFLDVDGVLAPFVPRCCGLLGIDLQDLSGAFERTQKYDLVAGLVDMKARACEEGALFPRSPGLALFHWRPPYFTEEDLWDRIRWGGEAFWSGMGWYEGAIDFYEDLLDLTDNRVTFLTSPARRDGGLSAMGKQTWIQKFHKAATGKDPNTHNFLIGPDKTATAGPGKLLIDDYTEKVDAYLAAGGHAIQFPAVWNRRRKLVTMTDLKHAYSTVLQEVEALLRMSRP